MVGERLKHTSFLDALDRTASKSPERARKLQMLVAKYANTDEPVGIAAVQKDKEKLRESSTSFLKRIEIVGNKIKLKKGIFTEDEGDSVTLLRYIVGKIKELKSPALENGENESVRLRLFDKCLREVTALAVENYLERPFKDNERRFLEIEFSLTLCCWFCHVDSKEDNVQGILSQSDKRVVEGDKQEVRNIGTNVIPFPRGKGFKPETGREGMEEGKPLITDVNEIIKAIRVDTKERLRREQGQWTRQEILEDMMKMYPGLKKELIDLLQIPDKLYHVPGEYTWEFVSEKGASNRAEMHDILRVTNYPLPAEVKFYSMGIFGFGGWHAAFFMTDPRRKLIFIECAPDPSEDGHWGELIKPLKNGVDWLKTHPKEDFLYLLVKVGHLIKVVPEE